jgi:hypothetical protein
MSAAGTMQRSLIDTTETLEKQWNEILEDCLPRTLLQHGCNMMKGPFCPSSIILNCTTARTALAVQSRIRVAIPGCFPAKAEPRERDSGKP